VIAQHVEIAALQIIARSKYEGAPGSRKDMVKARYGYVVQRTMEKPHNANPRLKCRNKYNEGVTASLVSLYP